MTRIIIDKITDTTPVSPFPSLSNKNNVSVWLAEVLLRLT